jgi:hypothetical protein
MAGGWRLAQTIVIEYHPIKKSPGPMWHPKFAVAIFLTGPRKAGMPNE